MKVLGLRAENFKILKAVEIIPGDGPVIIGGKNDQGKTSVMDAIWVALAGRAVAPAKPIRKGEEECRISLDIGDFVIQRKFRAKEDGNFTDSIKVLDDRGRIVPSPQRTLDDLLGAIGFDPFEFTKKKAEDQAAQLLELVPLPIDLEQFALDDARDYATRRDRNRDVESLDARIAAIPDHEGLPDKPVDRQALLDKLSSAAETNGDIEREKNARENERAAIARRRDDAARKRERVKQLRAEADLIEGEAINLESAAEEDEKRLNGMEPLPDPVDTAAIRADLEAADATNAKIAEKQRRAELVAQRASLAADAQAFTEAMEQREAQRREALAKAKMPVEGLGFAINERGKPVVTYRDLPFNQAGKAVQIKASTAIAMAANPDLRILRITDGSLLDEDSFKLIADMAEAEDFQLWVEVVGEGAAGIIIEDGSIKAAPTVPEEGTAGGITKDRPPAKKPKPKAGAAEKLL